MIVERSYSMRESSGQLERLSDPNRWRSVKK